MQGISLAVTDERRTAPVAAHGPREGAASAYHSFSLYPHHFDPREAAKRLEGVGHIVVDHAGVMRKALLG